MTAKEILTKGKNGTNNCFVTIALGKEKFQTSIKEKSERNVDWREECELYVNDSMFIVYTDYLIFSFIYSLFIFCILAFQNRTIPERGNRAELILTCLHRNNLGMDEFLGQVTLPLNEMDAYERPRSRWYKLQSKPGKEKKDKDRGELEARVAFTVKAGSLTDLSKKEKNKSSTLGLGGSLLSLNTLEKRKSLKKFAKSLGSKVHITGKKKDKNLDTVSISSSVSSLSISGNNQNDQRHYNTGQSHGDADPGVISEDDDEFAFDNLSNKSSASSINLKGKGLSNTQYTPSPLANQRNYANQDNEPPGIQIDAIPTKYVENNTKRDSVEVDEWEAKLYGKHIDSNSGSLKRSSWGNSNRKIDLENLTQEKNPTSNPFDQSDYDDDKNPFNENQSSRNKNTVDSIAEKQIESNSLQPIELPVKEKKDKSEKRFANKLKYFRKEKPSDTFNDENHFNKNIFNQQRQFSERIIIGHENDILIGHKQTEVPSALLKKYEGKSREVCTRTYFICFQ